MPKWAKVIFSTCHGSLTAMSGPASIILAVLTPLFTGSPRIAFAVAAYVGLLVFAVGVMLRNWALIQENKELLGAPAKKARQEFLAVIAGQKSRIRTEMRHAEGDFLDQSLPVISDAVYRAELSLPESGPALRRALDHFEAQKTKGDFKTIEGRIGLGLFDSKQGWERIMEWLEAFEKAVDDGKH